MSDNIKNDARAGGWIVYGWFTPDYRHWAEKLVGDLERLNMPYYMEAVAKAEGGWHVNTLQKADAVLRAMDRYPRMCIILLDVDCSVHGDLAPLAAIECDVALFLRARRRRDRWYTALRVNQKAAQTFLQPRSGTMLFGTSERTRRLVERWSAISRTARKGEDDETTLAMALGEGAGVTIHALATKWAAVEAAPDTVVLHVSAHEQQR